jgi:hypothetical protein
MKVPVHPVFDEYDVNDATSTFTYESDFGGPAIIARVRITIVNLKSRVLNYNGIEPSFPYKKRG